MTTGNVQIPAEWQSVAKDSYRTFLSEANDKKWYNVGNGQGFKDSTKLVREPKRFSDKFCGATIYVKFQIWRKFDLKPIFYILENDFIFFKLSFLIWSYQEHGSNNVKIFNANQRNGSTAIDQNSVCSSFPKSWWFIDCNYAVLGEFAKKMTQLWFQVALIAKTNSLKIIKLIS
jgi:hypothetical protein